MHPLDYARAMRLYLALLGLVKDGVTRSTAAHCSEHGRGVAQDAIRKRLPDGSGQLREFGEVRKFTVTEALSAGTHGCFVAALVNRGGFSSASLTRIVGRSGLLELVGEQLPGDGCVPAGGVVGNVEHQRQMQRVRAGGQCLVQDAI